jgi:RNA polymerase sigma-70 factor (ECF subfamily)
MSQTPAERVVRERSVEVELAAAAAAGDPRAQRRVVELVLHPVRAAAGYLTGRPDEAEDLAQIALVEILRSCRTFRGESALSTWASRIAVRVVMRHVKTRRRREQVVSVWAEPPEQSASESPEKREVRQRMAVCLHRIASAKREALVLKLVFGFRVEEIAELTGARVNTVRGRLRKGRQELRRQLLKDPVLRQWGPEA